MSVKIMAWAWGQESGSSGERLVLLALADHADPEGECYPSRERLAQMTGLTRSTVSRHVAALEEQGVLQRIARHRDNGSRTSTLYRLCVPPLRADAKGACASALTPEPSIEPSEEQQQRSSSSSPTPQPTSTESLDAVWARYVQQMKPRRREPDEEQRRVIRAALKVASVEECCAAIDKCAASDWHMKRGEHAERRGGRHNQLSKILKGRRGKETTRERIDFWLELAVETTDPDELTREQVRREQGLA